MGRVIRILLIDEEPWGVGPAKQFFQTVLAGLGAGALFQVQATLPHRVQNYDIVSLGERVQGGATIQLLDGLSHLCKDLAVTPYLNVHAPVDMAVVTAYQRLFQGRKVNFLSKGRLQELSTSGVAWEFPELGLVREALAPN